MSKVHDRRGVRWWGDASGFTLIELMVALAVMVIISTLAQAIFSTVLPKVRDMRRISDLKIMTDALRLYRLDHDTFVKEKRLSGLYVYSYDPDFLQDLVPDYLAKQPRDPINDIPVPFDWFDKKGHYYAYFYYATPLESNYYGCNGDLFAVVGIRKLEAGPKPDTPKAYCGPPDPFVCPPWGIPYLCRDWSLEFDASMLFYDASSL